jgi:hypothetical protein
VVKFFIFRVLQVRKTLAYEKMLPIFAVDRISIFVFRYLWAERRDRDEFAECFGAAGYQQCVAGVVDPADG